MHARCRTNAATIGATVAVVATEPTPPDDGRNHSGQYYFQTEGRQRHEIG